MLLQKTGLVGEGKIFLKGSIGQRKRFISIELKNIPAGGVLLPVGVW